ncbi:hypothetical protein JCM10908_003730 [Rhodotorula pacifica]|uniref:Tsr2p n=1 Tax=Rhodotorula pacifica TaxID=1495444 RepID=UPI0031793C13
MSAPAASTSTSGAAPAVPQPSAEDLALGLFARASLDLFDVWPALRLAISHGWGGNGQEGKTALAEDIVDLFYTVATSGAASTSATGASTSTSTQEGGVPVPAQDEVEQTLTYVIGNEFDVDLEDGSETVVARDLIALWRECIQRVQQQSGAGGAVGEEGPLAKKFRESAERARAQDGQQRFAAQRQGGGGDDDDDETTSEEDDDDEDDDDEDDEMEGVIDEPAPQLVESQPTRSEPVVDEDGFELVQPKKKGGRR